MIRGKARLWIIGALGVALVFAFWQWRAELRNAAQWAVGFDQVEQANRALERDLERMREEQQRNEQRAARHAQKIQTLQRQAERDTATRRELERTDDDYADWARDCLPRATRERLRIPANGCD